jgi:putative holliday junction resolvase
VTVSGTVLGFDYGARRVGVAVGETATRIANPLGTIEGEANEARFAAIDRYVAEWKPVAFVVGQPRHGDGSPHEVARLAGKFARRLAGRYKRDVMLVDETLTSATAEAQLRETRTRAARKTDVDALAATIILQSFLDQPEGHERIAS